MTLLITIFASIIATIVWYTSSTARKMKVGTLCYLFWGASLMWLVDAITEYIELKEDYFSPSAEDMLNDSFLGLSVIAIAMVIWLVCVLVKDPLGTIKNRNIK